MVPVRTCLGCRARVDSSELLRVVARDGIATPDPSGRSGGRGSWVHPTPQCIDIAIRRSAFARALRTPVDATGLATSGFRPEPLHEQAD